MHLTWDGESTGPSTVSTNGRGAFRATFIVPKTTPGAHTTGVTDLVSTATSGSGAPSAEFNVTAVDPTPVPTPTCRCSRPRGRTDRRRLPLRRRRRPRPFRRATPVATPTPVAATPSPKPDGHSGPDRQPTERPGSHPGPDSDTDSDSDRRAAACVDHECSACRTSLRRARPSPGRSALGHGPGRVRNDRRDTDR